MQKESTEKFVGSHGHQPRLAAVGVILPAKRDGAVRDVDDSVIRDRDAVGVARQILQHMFGSAERRFGVDDPVRAKERTEEGAKRSIVGETLKVARKRQSAERKRAAEAGDNLPAKYTAQPLDGKEE